MIDRLAMKEVAKLLNDMVRAGVISNYAVFGAVAQMRYTEAVVTLDADILVAVPQPEALAARHGLSSAWKTFQERFRER